jgi:sec-independent protein translocase protein TatA
MFRPGPEWIIVILVILLFVFGAQRLPEVGSSLGKGIRTFKSAVTGEEESLEKSQPEERGVNPNNTDDLV